MVDPPGGTPDLAMPPPLRVRQATSRSPGAVPVGLGIVTWIVVDVLTTVLVVRRVIASGSGVGVGVGTGVGSAAGVVTIDASLYGATLPWASRTRTRYA